jgi:anti-sigma B factor antagonist
MLEVKTKKLGSIAILCVRGQIITGQTEDLRNAVHAISEVATIILDFAGVSTIDAGGLGVLLELRAYAQERGIRFELMNVNKWVGRVLEVVRLDTVFNITSSVEFFPSVSRNRSTPIGNLASCA